MYACVSPDPSMLKLRYVCANLQNGDAASASVEGGETSEQDAPGPELDFAAQIRKIQAEVDEDEQQVRHETACACMVVACARCD